MKSTVAHHVAASMRTTADKKADATTAAPVPPTQQQLRRWLSCPNATKDIQLAHEARCRGRVRQELLPHPLQSLPILQDGVARIYKLAVRAGHKSNIGIGRPIEILIINY